MSEAPSYDESAPYAQSNLKKRVPSDDGYRRGKINRAILSMTKVGRGSFVKLTKIETAILSTPDFCHSEPDE